MAIGEKSDGFRGVDPFTDRSGVEAYGSYLDKAPPPPGSAHSGASGVDGSEKKADFAAIHDFNLTEDAAAQDDAEAFLRRPQTSRDLGLEQTLPTEHKEDAFKRALDMRRRRVGKPRASVSTGSNLNEGSPLRKLTEPGQTTELDAHHAGRRTAKAGAGKSVEAPLLILHRGRVIID